MVLTRSASYRKDEEPSFSLDTVLSVPAAESTVITVPPKRAKLDALAETASSSPLPVSSSEQLSCTQAHHRLARFNICGQTLAMNEINVDYAQYVIVKLANNSSQLRHIVAGAQVNLGKWGGLVKSSELRGKLYGRYYEVTSQGTLLDVVPEPFEATEAVVTRDNRNLVDNSSAQKLSPEEIDGMKRRVAKGQMNALEMIDAIAENSATFHTKNEFSQEKFQKVIQLIHPNAFTLCHHYFNQKASKIGYLRPDTLSQLLCASGVRSGANCLVLDNTGGLVLGAVLERLGGRGRAVALSLGPLYHIVGHFNFDAAIKNTLHVGDYQKAIAPFADMSSRSNVTAHSVEKGESSQNQEQIAVTQEIESHPTALSLDTPLSIAEKKRLHAVHDAQVSELLRASSPFFDSLIMAATSPPYDPYALLLPILPLIRPSRQIVIFSPYKECLAPAFEKARANKSLINIQLTESLSRQYQVLPGRMHPEMRTSGSGGFLLTMTTVLPWQPQTPA